MYKEIIQFLKCPICGNSMNLDNPIEENEEIITGSLNCECGKSWRIKNGVLDFESEEQEQSNRWSEIFKDNSLKEFNQMIREKTPENQRTFTDEATKHIIEFVNKTKPKFIVDIATGRGMLLEKLVENINVSCHLICTDLSFYILNLDRSAILKLNPKLKVSYIACDASNLPFKDKCFDLVVSLFGIANMAGLIMKGIKESLRILKSGRKLLNCVINTKKNSKSIQIVNEYYSAKGIHDLAQFLIKEEALKFHKEVGFTNIEYDLIGEDIAEKNELDLVPVENDWFSVGVIQAKK
jgi:ubiquinone/menaquinone biosynthesis C-methylase UbiE